MALAAWEEGVVDLVEEVVGERESPWDREEAVAVGRGLMAWKDAHARADGGEAGRARGGGATDGAARWRAAADLARTKKERILLLSWYKHARVDATVLPAKRRLYPRSEAQGLRYVRSVRMCGLR